MKNIILLSTLLALSTLTCFGQEATKGGQVLVAPKTIEKPKEQKAPPLAAPKMTNAVLGKPVVYSGYITEVVRAEKKRALFDLSAPPDPQKDLENVFFNSSPELAHPIILFRIKF